jgi:hypothetical protein
MKKAFHERHPVAFVALALAGTVVLLIGASHIRYHRALAVDRENAAKGWRR